MRQQMNLTTGTIGDKTLRFAIQLAVTGIMQQMFNAADVAVVGQFAGKNAMAAVGANSAVVGFLVNIFTGISLGANVVIARCSGAGDKKGIQRGVHTAVLFSVLGGIGFLLLGELAARPLLMFLGVPRGVLDQAVLYLRVYCLGLPVIFLYNFEAAIFRSQGDTRTPLICLMISGVANVLLNLVFVVGFGRAAEGVAAATVIANVLSSGMLLFLLIRQQGPTRLVLKELSLDRDVLASILRIGLPSGIQSSLFSISNMCIQSAVNSLGADVMAASSAAFNIEVMGYYVVNSFGQACTTFVSQNFGAGKLDRCRRTIRICLVQDLIVGTAWSLSLLAMGRPFLGLFNPDPNIAAIGLLRLRPILIFETVNAVLEVFAGAMRGFGYSMVPAVMSLFGVCGLRILWVFTVFRLNPDFRVLMRVYPVSWTITALAVFLAYLRLIRRLDRSSKPKQ